MNSLTLNARLISAAIAVATTLGLFSTVVSIAEPQRSVLMAKNHRSDQQRRRARRSRDGVEQRDQRGQVSHAPGP